MILDLRQIEFMDSTGLRVLLSAHQRAHETGRRFALVRGADQVERVLTLTGVRDLLTVVDAPEDLLTAGEQSSDGSRRRRLAEFSQVGVRTRRRLERLTVGPRPGRIVRTASGSNRSRDRLRRQLGAV